MPRRKRYVPQNIRWFNRIRGDLRALAPCLFLGQGQERTTAKALGPPFVLVSNHVSSSTPSS